jgi:hypothetical protein
VSYRSRSDLNIGVARGFQPSAAARLKGSRYVGDERAVKGPRHTIQSVVGRPFQGRLFIRQHQIDCNRRDEEARTKRDDERGRVLHDER